MKTRVKDALKDMIINSYQFLVEYDEEGGEMLEIIRIPISCV